MRHWHIDPSDAYACYVYGHGWLNMDRERMETIAVHCITRSKGDLKENWVRALERMQETSDAQLKVLKAEYFDKYRIKREPGEVRSHFVKQN